MFDKLAFREALKSWSIGMAIATPTIALLQGGLLLYDYRRNHGHAPCPEVPSQGVVIVSDDPNDPDLSVNKNKSRGVRYDWNTEKPPSQQPPLRLLVVGDSLAVGVGIRESRTPILPAAVARVLSRSLGGRAVHWTCVGTPGISSSLLVKAIYQMDDDDDDDLRPAMLKSLQEWQKDSRLRARERLLAARKSAEDWWAHRQDEDYYAEEIVEDEKDTSAKPANPVINWFNNRKEQIQRDFRGLREVARTFDPRRESDIELMDSLRAERGSEPHLTRRATVDPGVIGPYDIAIVLTGLNDLKDTFLPFMMSAKKKREIEEAQKAQKEENQSAFVRILHALEDKMDISIPAPLRRRLTLDKGILEENDLLPVESVPQTVKTPEPEQSPSAMRHSPLVVFPALPIGPIEPSHRAPLSWFVVPIIRGMDFNKKKLAEVYPGLVLFVEAPSKEITAQAERREGPLWENGEEELVLLQISDSKTEEKRSNLLGKTELLMREHYRSWFMDAEEVVDDDEDFIATFSSNIDRSLSENNQYQIQADGVSSWPVTRYQSSHVGATLVSCDGMHPNDHGYEFWGRYLGSKIADHLKRTNDEQR